MHSTNLGDILHYVRRACDADLGHDLSDAALLERFRAQREETAFAILVQRHGPMVLGVCRRILGDVHSADDSFQATFLVLVRRAASIRRSASLASWLHGVARRIAAKARVQAAARRARERRVTPMAPSQTLDDLTWQELRSVLDEEVERLPEKYRAPLVLCYFEGKSYEQAARELSLPKSSLASRLVRARSLLRRHLVRRGVVLSAGMMLTALGTRSDAAPLSALLIISTVRAAVSVATGRIAAGVHVSEGAARLAQDAIKGMLGVKSKLLLVVLTIGLALGSGSLPAHFAAINRSHLEPDEAVQAAGAKPDAAGPERKEAATDLYGDPLPPGALLRLGSSRLHHALSCTSVAFSPNSDLLASSGREGVVRFWDPRTGKELQQTIGPEKGVNAVAFSPNGKLLAGGGSDGVVYLWRAATGQVFRRLEGHKGEVRSLAFSRNGDLLAAGDTMDVRLWDVGAGKLLHRLEGKTGLVESVAFAPDGKTVTGTGMGIWATDSGKVVHDAPAKTPYAQAVIFSNDGKYLITIGRDANDALHVWDTTTGKMVERLSGPGGREPCVAMSPDGQLLAIASYDMIRLWDWTNGKEVRQIARVALPIHGLAFSRDGKTLASGGNWGAVRLWDVATGQEKVPVGGHQEGLTAVACASDSTIATTAWDGTVRLWDGRTGKQKVLFEISARERGRNELVNGGFSGGVAAQMLGHLALSPDGKQAAAARRDGIVMIWDTTTGREVGRYKASRLVFSPDNKRIATLEYGANGQVHNPDIVCLYDRASGKKLHEIRGRPATLWFDSPLFLPDSRTVIAIEFMISRDPKNTGFKNHDTQFVAWDVVTGRQRRPFPSVVGHNHQMRPSPDGRTLATRQLITSEKSMNGETIILWEIASGGRRADLVGHTSWVNEVAFSPDGRTLASASSDGTTRLWDRFTGKEISRLEGHRGWVQTVAFGPGGKTLVTGGTDATALVWDITPFLRRGKNMDLSTADLDSCWKDLAGDAPAGYRAIGRLLASPQQMIALFTERLPAAPKADTQRIGRLIRELDSEEFETRDAATKELEKLGEAASQALENALDGKIALEKKRRLEQLLERLTEDALPPDKLRQIRAVEALEHAATDEAPHLLQQWAREGAPGARLTREAEAALRRVKAR
jgi:RNA polymerase sigma factor (sigma-70 family)